MLKRNRLFKYPFYCILFISFLITGSLGDSHTRGSYLSNKVCIHNANNEKDIELALDAVRKAYDFFADLGFHEKYNIELFFEKTVGFEMANGNFIRTYGKLGKDNRIYLTDSNEPWLAEKNTYGLEFSDPFYESLIVHEVAHLLAEKIAGFKIEITLSEYIAYVVQISQMQPLIKRKILSRRDLSAFKTEEINQQIMMIDPAVFAVKSYLHHKQIRGVYLKGILSGAVQEAQNVAYWQFH
jgi:hypothetical protein